MNKVRALFASALIFAGFISFSQASSASTTSIPDTDFEAGTFDGWNKGSQNGSLAGGVISGDGTGVTIFAGSVTFSAGAHAAVGQPTVNGAPNPYYAPAVTATTWNFEAYGTKAVALQASGVQFNTATEALGLSASDNQAIRNILTNQRNLSGLGSPNPTDAAWITRSVTLSAGTTYSMAWNYIGTDYVPFNDGSITSLVSTSGTAGATITVNNGVGNFALLGFTNPGTGDYSTGHFGSTGWQIATYQVSVTGEYLLGFMVFNLGDTALSPVLLIDSQPGQTLKNGETFGAVVPNNPNAPTVAPTTPETSTTTTAPTTTSAPTTTAAPTTAPTTTQPAPPVVEIIEASIDFDGGQCMVNGQAQSATTSAIGLGYLYLPGPSECSKSGYVFDGWAVNGSNTASASLPLINDPSGDVLRYFIASDMAVKAVWSVAPTTTVSSETTVSIPVSDVTVSPTPEMLPNTGATSSGAFALGAMLTASGIFILTVGRRTRKASNV